MEVETTTEHFAEFESEVRETIADLGITGWDVYITHEDLDSGTAAQCTAHGVARRLQFALNTTTTDKTLEDVRRIARHEVCHAFLQPLAHYAGCRCVTEDELAAAEHEVIMRLMPLIDRLRWL